MNEIVDKKDDNSTIKDATTSHSASLSPNMTVQDLTNATLQFLCNASSEAIMGVTVALAFLTYFILGRIGLILIGGLAGVLLHATWEINITKGDMSTRKENSLDIVKRLLTLENKNAKIDTHDTQDEKPTYDFENFQKETATALKELVDAAIQDYVKFWYLKILPKDFSFVSATRQVLSHFILSISYHLSKKRPEDIFLDFLTNSSSILIVFLSELSAAITFSPGSTVEAVHCYLLSNPDSSLANALDKQQQEKKLKMTASDLLKNFVEKSIHDCYPVRIFLTEVLSGLVLESTLKTCSKPEWINEWIVFLLEKGESDLSQAIDAGMDKNRQYGFPEEKNDSFSYNGVAQQESHKKNGRLNKADEALDEAIEEAKRLSDLIALEDAKNKNQSQTSLDSKNEISVDSTERNSDFTVPIPKNLSLPNQNSSNLDRAKVFPRSQKPYVPSQISQSDLTSTGNDQTNVDSASGLRDSSPPIDKKTTPMTLHNAKVSIYDNTSYPERGMMRSKSNIDYLIQIEPANSNHPGWMIVRRYPDFETLHEVLRRIAQISGLTTFTEQHQGLPGWKEHSKEILRCELENYLRDACSYQPLAESEGMKRFFKKDQEQQILAPKNGFPGLTWSTSSAMGKGMIDAITGAPKGVAESSKAISGVLNNISNLGQKKTNAVQVEAVSRISNISSTTSNHAGRTSEESYIFSTGQIQSKKLQPSDQKLGYDLMTTDDQQKNESSSDSSSSSISEHQNFNQNQDPTLHFSQKNTPNSSPVQFSIDTLILPPPPTEMPDDYGSHSVNGSIAGHNRSDSNGASVRMTTGNTGTPRQLKNSTAPSKINNSKSGKSKARNSKKAKKPLTESETRVAVELIFAVINEMYTISSAWNIRRTLLTAAKTYFLRPGNPSLSQIQSLIQDSVISANTSDTGIAAHIRKLRENCMPSEEMSKTLPSEMSSESKERLRIKARKLLIERSVPTALTGVMGQAATTEAMGRIFDYLQIEDVARGLIFCILLQGLRAIFD